MTILTDAYYENGNLDKSFEIIYSIIDVPISFFFFLREKRNLSFTIDEIN